MDTVTCEYCGKTLPKVDAKCTDEGTYACPECAVKNLVKCERCGAIIDYGNAYRGFDGYLCECCHDDLFG